MAEIKIDEAIKRLIYLRRRTLYVDDQNALSAGIAALTEITKRRWIPCSERLPEQDTMVIVCYFGCDMIMPMQGETVTEAMARQNKVPTVTMGFLSEEGWNGADFFPLMVQPTFWMPLPDPPERSEEH